MRYLTTRDLAEAAQLSAPYVRDCVRRGELAAITIGHGKRPVLRYSVAEAIRFFRAKGFDVPAAWLALMRGDVGALVVWLVACAGMPSS